MNDLIFALMREYGMQYGQARDTLVSACLGDSRALNAVLPLACIGEID